MEVNPEKFKNALRFTIGKFKELDSELLAHRLVLLWVKEKYGIHAEVDLALSQTLDSPQVQQTMHQKYDVTLEKLLEQFDEANLEKGILEWFQKWKPQGPVN